MQLMLQGTILPGITRKSILELAASKGYDAQEAPVSLEEALQADEVFTCGTAVVLSPVGSLTHQGKKTQYGEAGVPGRSHAQLGNVLMHGKMVWRYAVRRCCHAVWCANSCVVQKRRGASTSLLAAASGEVAFH